MPYPSIPAAQQTELDGTLTELRKFLDEHLDPAEIDRQVRALLGPYPRAFVTVESSRIPVRGVVPLVFPGPDRRGVEDADEYLLPFRCADGVVGLIPDSNHEQVPVPKPAHHE